MLDVDDMVMVKIPDAKSIMTFLVTIYQHFNWQANHENILGLVEKIKTCPIHIFCFSLVFFILFYYVHTHSVLVYMALNSKLHVNCFV